MSHLPQTLAAIATFILCSPVAHAEEPTGKWTGNVDSVPVILTIATNDTGKLAAWLESPSQAPGQKLPVDEIASNGSELSFASAMLDARYAASWDSQQQAWIGVFIQGDVQLPLILSREKSS